MGAILAKFRKEKSTATVLEGLEEKITQIERYTINTQEQKRRIVGNFLAISIGIYVIAFIVFYFVYFPPTWRERLIYSVPLLLFPLVIILLRRLFTWYFERKLTKNSVKLTALHAEKKKILEQVMDKETYKVAVKLLARYGDKINGQKSLYGLTPRAPTIPPALNITHQRSNAQSPSGPTTASNLQDLRLRPTLATASLSTTPRQLVGIRNSPVATGAAVVGQVPSSRSPLPITPQRRPLGVGGIVAGQELRKQRPFPIVSQQGKGVFERIVDVLIGDGPKDRFAMICKECYAHNGMALQEDFDYKPFHCAFCNTLNPARKARPVAPRLPEQHYSHLKRKSYSSSSSSSDVESENDEPVTSIPTLTATSAAPPRIELTEPPNNATLTSTIPFETSSVTSVVMHQRQLEIGAENCQNLEAADAAGIEKAEVKEPVEMEMEIEETEVEKTAGISAKVVANLKAVHDAEVEELNRLQERFAKMYATPDEVQKQERSENLDDEIVEKELQDRENIDELKKLK